MFRWSPTILVGLLVACISMPGLLAQRARKTQRAQPPQFTGKEFSGTFFEDVTSQLQGARPSGPMAARAPASTGPAGTANTSNSAPEKSQAAATGDTWTKLISGSTIEDIVKNSKLRLDALVANQNKFAGGYVEVRREFSLQALMFAVIEQYPGEVRWKRSAALAREAFIRVAASSKVTSPQAFKEAKQRVQDLSELLSGNNLDGSAAAELDWSGVIDRVPLMQLLDWAQQGHINNFSSSKENFDRQKEELKRFSQLVAVLGKAAIMKDMPDADDAQYQAFGQQMIEQAQQIVLAVETDNADLARKAAGQMGQSCAKCHDDFR